ncbi:MAG: hypothetical protein Q8R82_06490 [Hyphomonadaceae bacterium]|nr:hypothetical protein [Hyphomonadaceae bacterium]
MLKWICMAGLAAAMAGPAFAQKTDLPDRALKQTKPFDQASIKEGLTALKQGGECTVQYIVGVNGRAKDIATDCTVADMAPYIARAVETGEWDAEITGGEFFDSFPIKQVFKFGSQQAVDPRGEKSPVMVSGIPQKAIERAIAQVNQDGKCDVKFTVAADGKPKDITPNCQPSAYDPKVVEGMASMKFEPGLKGGAPTDWPGLSMPMTLTKPKG